MSRRRLGSKEPQKALNATEKGDGRITVVDKEANIKLSKNNENNFILVI